MEWGECFSVVAIGSDGDDYDDCLATTIDHSDV